MFLVICATEFELQSLLDCSVCKADEWMSLVTGVGMVETAFNLTRFLEKEKSESEYEIHAVLNFGVAGAYLADEEKQADLLQVCLAEKEFFGDMGICYPDRMEPLAEDLLHRFQYVLDSDLLNRAESLLEENGLQVRRGNFVTVCGVSATASRGAMLRQRYDALCENMEGAAVARICEEYMLPLLEMRAVSNYVEDRDLTRWKLKEACDQAGKAAAMLLKGLKNE